MGPELSSIGPLIQSALRWNARHPQPDGGTPDPDAADTPEIQPDSAHFSLLKVSVELHLERSVQDQAGNVIGRDIYDVSLRYQRVDIASIIADVQEAPEEEPVEDAKKKELPPGLRKLLEYFSPENTAQRIASFVQKGFGRTSFGAADTEDNRRSFVDFITPFIRQGMDSALSLFGALPDEARQDAETTFTRVQEILEEFVTGKATAPAS